MLEMRFDEEDKSITFLEFTKNRRGSIGKRLYFDLRNGGEIIWAEPTVEPQELPTEERVQKQILDGDSLEMRALARLYPE
jgi:hypothetical protein